MYKSLIELHQPPFCQCNVVGSPSSVVYNMDCIEGMKHYPDNYFDLAICDPPYGYENKTTRKESNINSGNKFAIRYNGKNWNNKVPEISFYNELFRVSKNQIVFGANYFTNFLPISRGWIYWHKQGEKMSSVNDELIWTSYDVQIQKFSRCHGLDKGFMADHKVFHPTTKPISLYDFCFQFAKVEAGAKVLDTHLGSGSSRISAYHNGFEFVGFEIDEDYCKSSDKRFKDAISQQRLVF